MPKRAANGLTLLSAVVCAGSLLLVGRSFFRCDSLSISAVKETVSSVGTIDGQLWLLHGPAYRFTFYSSQPVAAVRAGVSMTWGYLRGFPRLGIGWGSMFEWKYLILPLWLLPVLTAIPPARWWRARRRGGRGFPVESAAPAG